MRYEVVYIVLNNHKKVSAGKVSVEAFDAKSAEAAALDAVRTRQKEDKEKSGFVKPVKFRIAG